MNAVNLNNRMPLIVLGDEETQMRRTSAGKRGPKHLLDVNLDELHQHSGTVVGPSAGTMGMIAFRLEENFADGSIKGT